MSPLERVFAGLKLSSVLRRIELIEALVCTSEEHTMTPSRLSEAHTAAFKMPSVAASDGPPSDVPHSGRTHRLWRAGVILASAMAPLRSLAAAAAAPGPAAGPQPDPQPLAGRGSFDLGSVVGMQGSLRYNTNGTGGRCEATLVFRDPRGHQRLLTRPLAPGGWQVLAVPAEDGGLVAFGNDVATFARLKVRKNDLQGSYNNRVTLRGTITVPNLSATTSPVGVASEMVSMVFNSYPLPPGLGTDLGPGLAIEVRNASGDWQMLIRQAPRSSLAVGGPATQPKFAPAMAPIPTAVDLFEVDVDEPQAPARQPGRQALAGGLYDLGGPGEVLAELDTTAKYAPSPPTSGATSALELSTRRPWHHRLTLTRRDNAIDIDLLPTQTPGLDVWGAQAVSVSPSGVTSQILFLESQDDLTLSAAIDAFYTDEPPHVVINVAAARGLQLNSCWRNGTLSLGYTADDAMGVGFVGRCG